MVRAVIEFQEECQSISDRPTDGRNLSPASAHGIFGLLIPITHPSAITSHSLVFVAANLLVCCTPRQKGRLAADLR